MFCPSSSRRYWCTLIAVPGFGIWIGGCSQSRCIDSDGDGYPARSTRCWEATDIDCDDGDPLLNHDDLDGDGYSTCEYRLPDCDDLDSTRHHGASEIPCDGIDQDCDGEDVASLELSVYGTWPQDQAADVHPRTFVQAHLVAAGGDSWTFPQETDLSLVAENGEAVGGTVEQTTSHGLFFRPHALLEPDTGYSATVTVGECAPLDWTFETGDAGTEVSSSLLQGADYFIDHGTGWVTDINGSHGSWEGFEDFVEVALHVGAVDDDLSRIDIFSAVVDHDDGVMEQDLCLATSPWVDDDPDAPAHWYDPYFFAFGFGFDFYYDYDDTAVGRVVEASASGSFRSGGDRIDGIVLDELLDVSFLSRAHVQGIEEDDDPCDVLLGALGVSCIECPDGYAGCVRQRIELLEAHRAAVSSVHPETGEELDSLMEVTQQQVDAWTAAGYCP